MHRNHGTALDAAGNGLADRQVIVPTYSALNGSLSVAHQALEKRSAQLAGALRQHYQPALVRDGELAELLDEIEEDYCGVRRSGGGGMGGMLGSLMQMMGGGGGSAMET